MLIDFDKQLSVYHYNSNGTLVVEAGAVLVELLKFKLYLYL